jgi:hypothetical protein
MFKASAAGAANSAGPEIRNGCRARDFLQKLEV